MNKDEKIDFSSKISERIKNGKVKMRSHLFFIAEKLGLESGLLLTIILGVLLISLALYIMQQNGVFEFAEFGPRGWRVVLQNIPYDLLALVIVFFILANLIIKQFDFSYRHPFYIFSSGIIFIVGIIGFIVFWTGVTDAIYGGSTSILNDVAQKRIIHTPNGHIALIGRVVGSKDKAVRTILIQTPQNQIIKVNFDSDLDNDDLFAEGHILKIIGQKQGENFKAELVKILTDSYNRYFRSVSKPVLTN